MNRIYIITGPSGAGKSSVALELLRLRPQLKKVVTCTTRAIRPGETDGVSYHFLTRETFQRLIDEQAMFEWDEHYDHLYGSRTSDVEQLMQEGNDVLFVVDVAGAKTIKESNPQATIFFIKTETPDILLEWIQKRDKGQTTGLEERKRLIDHELSYQSHADHIIVNKEGKLKETIKEIQDLMQNS